MLGALKVCNDKTCPNLTEHAYCDKHRREREHQRERRGSTSSWRRIRQRVLERDGHQCFYCGGHATHVDHRKPVAAGGTDDLANLVAACATCNLRKGAGHAHM